MPFLFWFSFFCSLFHLLVMFKHFHDSSAAFHLRNYMMDIHTKCEMRNSFWKWRIFCFWRTAWHGQWMFHGKNDAIKFAHNHRIDAVLCVAIAVVEIWLCVWAHCKEKRRRRRRKKVPPSGRIIYRHCDICVYRPFAQRTHKMPTTDFFPFVINAHLTLCRWK